MKQRDGWPVIVICITRNTTHQGTTQNVVYLNFRKRQLKKKKKKKTIKVVEILATNCVWVFIIQCNTARV